MDFKEGYYPSPLFVKWLMTADSLEGHNDGFGFFLESKREVYKSKLSAVNWFVKNYYNSFSRLRNTNGMYHVRRASVKAMPTEIKDEHAHPFKMGNLVMAHNGTLELQVTSNDPLVNKELFSDDLIDSQKLLIVLSHYYTKNKNVLTEEVIKSAVSEFFGSFVLLIRDISTKDFFIVRDETKELSIATFFKDKEVVGNMWNTRYYMLDLLSEIYLDMHPDLECTVTIVPKETIHKYTLGVYDSFKKVADIRNPVRRYKGGHISNITKAETGAIHIGPQTSNSDKNTTEVMGFFASASKCFLTLEDIFILYELLYKKSILNIESKDMAGLMALITKIDKIDWTEKRADALQNALAIYTEDDPVLSPVFEFSGEFNTTVFSYPLICNGKDKLEAVVKAVQEIYQ